MNKESTANLSEKHKKSEILREYHKLLTRLREKKETESKEEIQQKENKQVVEEAANLSPDKIVRGLAEVKLQMTQAFELLEKENDSTT